MKRYTYLAVTLMIAGTAAVTAILLPKHSVKPQPIEIVSEESDNYIRRQEWIEAMHKTAPGVDWREMDQQTRQEMYEQKLPALQEAGREGQEKSGVIESIANGYLTGQWIEKGSSNMAGRVHCVDIDFTPVTLRPYIRISFAEQQKSATDLDECFANFFRSGINIIRLRHNS